MSMIETTNLTKRYGDLTAVDGIDLTVERGSIHGFVGPNGAGKTTTMQMLVGLIAPTAGEAFIDGEPAGSIEAKRAIGYAPQEPAFYESMSGFEYLKYMGRAAGMDSSVGERAGELFDWLELEDASNQQISGYSGGMRRRLSLAQAMIHEPDLLILDEPTATLDPEGRRSIIDSLVDLTREGMTVFVSSHVLAELEQFIETVTILHEGELIQTGSIDDVADTYGGEAYLVESSDNESLAELLEDHELITRVQHNDDGSLTVVTDDPDSFTVELQSLMAEAGIRLESLQQEGGLEEAFIDLIDDDTGGE